MEGSIADNFFSGGGGGIQKYLVLGLINHFIGGWIKKFKKLSLLIIWIFSYLIYSRDVGQERRSSISSFNNNNLFYSAKDPLDPQDFGFLDPDPQKYADPRIRI